MNVEVEAKHIYEDSKLQFELDLGSTCPGGGKVNIPESGPLELDAIDTGTLKITYVPIGLDSEDPPEISAAQLKRYGDLLRAQYPTQNVEVTLDEPVEADTDVGRSGQCWGSLVNAMRGLRDDRNVPPDVHYYGLIQPAASFRQYCQGGCVAGVSLRPTRAIPSMQVGLGVGFDDETSSEAMSHEIGHQHGFAHSPSPCGGARPADVIDPADSMAVPYRSAIIGPDGTLAFGHTILPGQPPVGAKEKAQVLDRAARPIATVDIYRAALDHGVGTAVDMPPPQPEWAWLQISGLGPVSLQGRPTLPRLRSAATAIGAPTGPLQLP